MNSSLNLDKKLNNLDEEINLIHFLNIALRNKFFISTVTFISIVFGLFYAFFQKKLWEGQFQIVLNKENKNSLASQLLGDNSELSLLSGLGLSDGNSSLKTELEILKSPSVLMPVFEYIKQQKLQSDKSFKNISFSNWRKNYLNVSLKKGTSVLNFSFKDNDRNLILPSLSKITKTYQDYSGKSRKRNLSLSEEYLNGQIKKYKLRSSKSFNLAQDFAIQKDLIINNFSSLQKPSFNFQNNQENKKASSNITGSIVGIEEIRVQSVNKIRNIEERIKKIENLENNYNELQYIGSTIPALVETGLLEELQIVDKKLAFLKSSYKENSRTVRNFSKEKLILMKLVKDRALGFLKAEKLETEALLETLIRPKEVLIKYRELIREAARDEKTLIQLENNLNIIKLENARYQQPWDLITEPTLIPSPVEPNKKNIVFIFTLLGLLSSYVFSILKEKISGVVYEKDILENILNAKILDTLNVSSKSFKSYSKDIFQKEILDFDIKNKIHVFFSSSIKTEDDREVLSQIFDREADYQVVESFTDTKDEKILFLAKLSSTKINELENIKKRLLLTNKNLFGILLLE